MHIVLLLLVSGLSFTESADVDDLTVSELGAAELVVGPQSAIADHIIDDDDAELSLGEIAVTAYHPYSPNSTSRVSLL